MRVTWLSWLVGLALFGAVVFAALHVSEAGSFADLVEQARPGWLALAVVLQAGTYLAQAQIWRAVLRAAGMHLPVGMAYRLSLVKLLVDQALPSSGLSGAVVVAGALQRQGAREETTTAGIVVSSVGYLLAYAASLLAGLGLLAEHQPVQGTLLVAGFALLAAAAALAFFAMRAASRGPSHGPKKSHLPGWLAHILDRVAHADAALARSPRLLALSAGLQLCIIALDCLTVWALIRSLGADAPVVSVFTSFMVASLLRTVSIVPGGLGAFEAASVLALHGTGVAVPVALSATLLFRGLSFWLPMLPGAWLARGLLRQPPPPGTQ